MIFAATRRFLQANRSYAVTVVGTLALGLAAVGLMFAVVYTVLLRPLPFRKPDRVMTISQKIPAFGSSPAPSTAEEFQNWQRSGLFESAALLDTAEYTLEWAGHPERIYGVSVTPDFFHVLGVKPVMGRGIGDSDAAAGQNNRVMVLSHQLWARRFASDRQIVGKTIRLDSGAMTVIGVMPAGFDFPRRADVGTVMNAPAESEFWVPFVITPKLVEEGNFDYFVLGRLREGVSRERAAQQFRASAIQLFRRGEVKYPQYKDIVEQMISTLVIYVTPLRETMAWGIRDVLWMLLGAVGLLLALVLFNVGSLLLTKNAQRSREYTVRQALGASRWQLFRQSFAEQAALAGMASVLALLLMRWGIDIIQVAGANRLPRLYELQLDLAPVALMALTAFLTATLFGTLSQFLFSESAGRFSLQAALQSQSRTATGDQRTNRLKSVLLVAEVAIAVVLLVGAGLLAESFAKVMQENPGFDASHVLAVKVSFDPRKTETPEKRLAHMRELLDEFRHLPGVQSASLVNQLPLTGDNNIRSVQAVGKSQPQSPQTVTAEYRVVDAAYFQTMRIPLLAGRYFRQTDPGKFTIINQKIARRLWPGEDPIGKQLSDSDHPAFTVIGVAGDVHNGALETPPMMQFYRILAADPYNANTFVMRTTGDPESMVPAVQRAVWRLDASEPVTHPETMEHLLRAATLQRRFESGLLTGFAAVAMLLSAMGLFGAVSLSVARRTRELGIRMALGATAGRVMRGEMGRAAIIVLAGLAAGVVMAATTAGATAGLLYGVAPWSGKVYAAAVVVLGSSGLLAVWLPARRAARIDPASALRSE